MQVLDNHLFFDGMPVKKVVLLSKYCNNMFSSEETTDLLPTSSYNVVQSSAQRKSVVV